MMEFFLSFKVKILRRCTKGEEKIKGVGELVYTFKAFKTTIKHNLMDTPLDFFTTSNPQTNLRKNSRTYLKFQPVYTYDFH